MDASCLIQLLDVSVLGFTARQVQYALVWKRRCGYKVWCSVLVWQTQIVRLYAPLLAGGSHGRPVSDDRALFDGYLQVVAMDDLFQMTELSLMDTFRW